MSLEIAVIMFATGILVFPLFQGEDVVRQLLLSIFYAIKIPTMNGNFQILENYAGKYVDYYKYLLYLYAALSPLLTVGIIVTFIEEKIDLFYASMHTNKTIHVFSKINEKSILLANSLKDKHQKIIFCDVENIKNRDMRLKKMKALCLKKKIHELNYSCYKNIVNVYAMSESSEQNVNQVLKLIENNRNTRNSLTAYVFTTNDDTQIILDSTEKGNVKTIMVNTYRQMVYDVLNNCPLYIQSSDVISVLIVGAGNIGKEFVKTIPWCGQVINKELEIHVLDKSANQLEKRMAWDCPELCKPYYNISYYQVDVLSNDTRKVLDNNCQNVNYIVVSLGNDDLNLKTAIQMRQYYLRHSMHPVIAVVIKNEERKQQIDILKGEKSCEYDFYPFGSIHEIYNKNSILNPKLEKRAKNVHLSYASDDVDFKEYYRNEYNKKSSFATALHMTYKLYALTNGETVTHHQLEELLKDETNIQALQENEHNRWMSYVRSEGYCLATIEDVQKYMPITKNHIYHLAKLHPCLVNYNDLDELTEQINSLYQKNGIDKKVDFAKSDVDIILNMANILKEEL